MKRWQIVYGLPLEVWVDIFCYPWISRKEFGQLVDRIGNFMFAEHAQFFLHEWGRRTLGKGLNIDEKYVARDGKDKLHCMRLDDPQTPLPMNIKSFNRIDINHFNTQTMDFLDKIRPLLTGLEIGIVNIMAEQLAALRTILAAIAPVLDGIRSLYCADKGTFPVLKEHLFRANEKLAELKWLNIYGISDRKTVNFVVNWLAQPDTDGPRLLEFHNEHPVFSGQILKAIREQFIAAKTPRTFGVHLRQYSWQERRAAGFHLANGIGEALHGEWAELGRTLSQFQITRHPANCETKEARKWIEQMTKGRTWPRIWINHETVGSLDVAQMDVPKVDGEQAEQEPCSSKDI